MPRGTLQLDDLHSTPGCSRRSRCGSSPRRGSSRHEETNYSPCSTKCQPMPCRQRKPKDSCRRNRCGTECQVVPSRGLKSGRPVCDKFTTLCYPRSESLPREPPCPWPCRMPPGCCPKPCCPKPCCPKPCPPPRIPRCCPPTSSSEDNACEPAPSSRFVEDLKSVGPGKSRFKSHLCPWEADVTVSGTIRAHCTSTADEVTNRLKGPFGAYGKRFTTDSDCLCPSPCGHQTLSLGMLDDGGGLDFSKNHRPTSEGPSLESRIQRITNPPSPTSPRKGRATSISFCDKSKNWNRDTEHSGRERGDSRRDTEHSRRDMEHSRRDTDHSRRYTENSRRDMEHWRRDTDHSRRYTENSRRDTKQCDSSDDDSYPRKDNNWKMLNERRLSNGRCSSEDFGALRHDQQQRNSGERRSWRERKLGDRQRYDLPYREEPYTSLSDTERENMARRDFFGRYNSSDADTDDNDVLLCTRRIEDGKLGSRNRFGNSAVKEKDARRRPSHLGNRNMSKYDTYGARVTDTRGSNHDGMESLEHIQFWPRTDCWERSYENVMENVRDAEYGRQGRVSRNNRRMYGGMV